MPTSIGSSVNTPQSSSATGQSQTGSLTPRSGSATGTSQTGSLTPSSTPTTDSVDQSTPHTAPQANASPRPSLDPPTKQGAGQQGKQPAKAGMHKGFFARIADTLSGLFDSIPVHALLGILSFFPVIGQIACLAGAVISVTKVITSLTQKHKLNLQALLAAVGYGFGAFMPGFGLIGSMFGTFGGIDKLTQNKDAAYSSTVDPTSTTPLTPEQQSNAISVANLDAALSDPKKFSDWSTATRQLQQEKRQVDSQLASSSLSAEQRQHLEAQRDQINRTLDSAIKDLRYRAIQQIYGVTDIGGIPTVAPQQGHMYTPHKGDTLASLAAKLNVSGVDMAKAIRTANGIPDGQDVPTDRSIYIPTTAQAQQLVAGTFTPIVDTSRLRPGALARMRQAAEALGVGKGALMQRVATMRLSDADYQRFLQTAEDTTAITSNYQAWSDAMAWLKGEDDAIGAAGDKSQGSRHAAIAKAFDDAAKRVRSLGLQSVYGITDTQPTAKVTLGKMYRVTTSGTEVWTQLHTLLPNADVNELKQAVAAYNGLEVGQPISASTLLYIPTASQLQGYKPPPADNGQAQQSKKTGTQLHRAAPLPGDLDQHIGELTNMVGWDLSPTQAEKDAQHIFFFLQDLKTAERKSHHNQTGASTQAAPTSTGTTATGTTTTTTTQQVSTPDLPVQ